MQLPYFKNKLHIAVITITGSEIWQFLKSSFEICIFQTGSDITVE